MTETSQEEELIKFFTKLEEIYKSVTKEPQHKSKLKFDNVHDLRAAGYKPSDSGVECVVESYLDPHNFWKKMTRFRGYYITE